jgi:HAD superfamily hydrolase (TIGR01450 family)
VTRPLVDGSDRPLAAVHDVALLDLDGVLYVGPDAVPGAPEAVAAAAAAGLRPAYVTNNAARTPGTVAEHLRALGVPADATDVVTSAQATARLVAERVPAGSAVLVVGGEGLVAALTERGLRPVAEMADDVAAVVQGFAPEVGWRLLAEGTYAVSAGLPWVASNLDATVPTAKGTAPGNGALVGVVADAAGRRPDAVAGKPEAPLHRESVERTGAERPIVVGDRLDTDIEGANRAGTPSLLVLTGVCRPADLLRASAGLRPTYVAADLWTGLLDTHPAVRAVDGGWQCREIAVRVEGTDVTVDGATDDDAGRVDALRALCVAWWAAEVADADDDAVRTAVAAAGW